MGYDLCGNHRTYEILGSRRSRGRSTPDWPCDSLRFAVLSKDGGQKNSKLRDTLRPLFSTRCGYRAGLGIVANAFQFKTEHGQTLRARTWRGSPRSPINVRGRCVPAVWGILVESGDSPPIDRCEESGKPNEHHVLRLPIEQKGYLT